MSGPGEKAKHARFVVLVQDHNGRQHAWEIRNGEASWVWTGLVAGSSHAEVKVRGEFFRISRDVDPDDQPTIEPIRDRLTEFGGT